MCVDLCICVYGRHWRQTSGYKFSSRTMHGKVTMVICRNLPWNTLVQLCISKSVTPVLSPTLCRQRLIFPYFPSLRLTFAELCTCFMNTACSKLQQMIHISQQRCSLHVQWSAKTTESDLSRAIFPVHRMPLILIGWFRNFPAIYDSANT